MITSQTYLSPSSGLIALGLTSNTKWFFITLIIILLIIIIVLAVDTYYWFNPPTNSDGTVDTSTQSILAWVNVVASFFVVITLVITSVVWYGLDKREKAISSIVIQPKGEIPTREAKLAAGVTLYPGGVMAVTPPPGGVVYSRGAAGSKEKSEASSPKLPSSGSSGSSGSSSSSFYSPSGGSALLSIPPPPSIPAAKWRPPVASTSGTG